MSIINKSKTKVLKNSFYYLLSSILTKAVGFLMLPFYTAYLSPEDYGISSLVNGFTHIAIYFVSLSLFSAALRFYSDFESDHNKLARFYSTITLFVLINGASLVCAGWLFRHYLILIIFDGIPFYPIVFVALLIMVFVAIATLYQNVLQGRQEGRRLATVNFVMFVFSLLLKITLVVYVDLGVLGIVLAILITNMVYAALLFRELVMRDLFRFVIDLKILWEALKYSVPMMPHHLSTRVSSITSRIILNKYLSLAVVGVYSISMQFGNLVDVIQISINRAFQPWFFKTMKDHEHSDSQNITEFSYLLLIPFSVLYLIIGVFAEEFVIIMTNYRYYDAWKVIPILVAGYSIKSIYYIYLNILMYYKYATKRLFIASSIGSGADILFALLLIPQYGMYGASIAFLGAKFVMVAIIIRISSKFNIVGYDYRKIFKIIIPNMVVMGLVLAPSYLAEPPVVLDIWKVLYKLASIVLFTTFQYQANKSMILKYKILDHLKKAWVRS